MSGTPAADPGPPARQSFLDRLDDLSARAARWLFHLAVYGGLPALVVLVTLDVILRYFFDAPIRWSRDANGLLLLITMFGALPHAWDAGYHIRMELIYERLHGLRRALADVTAALCGIVFFGLLAFQAARFVPFMARVHETGEDLLISMWPFMAYVGLSAVVFVLRLVSNPTARRQATASEQSAWI